MSHTQYEALISRLEQAVRSIEAVAHKAGSSVSAALHADHTTADVTPASAAWAELETNELAAFEQAARHHTETTPLADAAHTAFKRVGELIAASSQSKKPSDADLMAFLKPIIGVIEKTGNPDKRSATFNQQKAFAEGITSVNWVAISPPNGSPKEIAQSGVEQADFYLIKVLTEAKSKSGKEQEDLQAFAQTFKALLQKQTQFVADHFKMGLDYNPKGNSLLSWSPSSSSSAGVPPPPPGAPDAPAAPSFTTQASNAASAAATAVAGGMGAVFSQLSNLGDGVTGGLRKVTADMKTKNRSKDDVPAPVVPKSAPSTTAPKAAATTAPKREARTYQNKGTWFVEYYTGGEVTIENLELKESVYILGCTNTTVKVPVKCKSIQVDSCKRTNVDMKSVVSTFEVVNSDRIHVYINEIVPSVALDKTDGSSIHLVTREAAAKPPQIVTSKISECNLVVPGKTDDDDPIEMPIPEQFITLFENGRLKTESVAHSAN